MIGSPLNLFQIPCDGARTCEYILVENKYLRAKVFLIYFLKQTKIRKYSSTFVAF